MDLSQITPAQLRQAANLKEQIEELQRELESILGGSAPTESQKPHWTQTAAGRARLKKSARLAWRTRRGSASPSNGNGQKVHWTQTPAGRAKMAKLMQRRWQKRRTAAAVR
jgi:hypothetical protein